MRAWEEFYETNPDPTVLRVWRHWRRNRALFDELDGLGMANREIEFALREQTDAALRRLNEAEDAWEAVGYAINGFIAGRPYRTWGKRRMDFFKALYAENREYEGVIRHHGLDPDDDDAMAVLMEDDEFADDSRLDG